MSVKLKPILGVNEFVGLTGQVYLPGVDGALTVDPKDVTGLLAQGCALFALKARKISLSSPLPADLVSIKAAATPANGAITIAAQPPQARKLQVRVILGTGGTTDVTAGTLTLVGTDTDGAAITEVVSLVTAGASATYKTKNAYSGLVSGTVAGYAANGSGTGNTLGLGVSNDFGCPTEQGGNVLDFAAVKVSKTVKVLGTSNVTTDDVASTAVVDPVARTIAPTTAPAASGLDDFEITYVYA